MSRRHPACSAAFASWIWRTSFCVIVSSGSPSASTYEKVRPSATIRGVRAASAPSIVPSVVITPARWSSAIASTIPEPQTPVTRVAGEPRLVRPGVAADHAEARLERLGVDPHALDRAGRGALAAADLRTLERRPGRAGRGEQALPVPEHDLGVRADVDDQVHLVDAGAAPRRGSRPAVSAPTWPAMHGQHVHAGAGDARAARARAPAGAAPRRRRARTARRRARSGRARAAGGA